MFQWYVSEDDLPSSRVPGKEILDWIQIDTIN